ncbi:pullulanase [Metabacillus crassostreae]|uniref:type I pullulanase n=1 Tax=Metabacillus crassostreae TaxID=929098 RepID=UPI00195BA45A|nr:type I pullulanase [Metabacillus crassostreae]MBM7606131.1 pullulanase [Metabacillus crassostreae]
MLSINRSFEAFLDTMDEITILIPIDQDCEDKTFYLKLEDYSEALLIKEKVFIEGYIKYICKPDCDIEFGKTYNIVDDDGSETDLQIGAVIRLNEFDNMFAYEGHDLGVTYFNEKIICKVWAPTATEVKLRLYDQNINEYGTYEMVRCEKGTWSITLEGDYEKSYYTFLTCINLMWNEVIDPYAKAVSINGLYGVIINKEKTAIQKISTPLLENKTDAIIYEAHIRDFSIHPDSGIVNKGQYDGWLETETLNSYGDSTGLSYLSELGVTHIELLPINDYEEVDETNPLDSYNWGYNPLHFFAPEGSYSQNPRDPYKRIIEVKKLIQKLHECGFKVIIDVVYNHVYSKENSSFEKLLPGYYFRHDENGFASNGTGVGNDLASERSMVRKFILDCAQYWLEEYDVDGFRFDLMGIMDIDTMKELQSRILSIKKDAFLLGEGWDLNTPLAGDKKATIANANTIPKISFFNDQFRDVIKGSTFSVDDCGFVYTNLEKYEQMKNIISGSANMFLDPHQSINYVESHDNHTMWDRFQLYAPDEDNRLREARHRLATSIVLLSQGVPFIHAAQEFFRTKQGVENSYNSSDEINWINWNERSTHKENIEYVKELIQLRKLHGAFRLPSSSLIKEHLLFDDREQELICYLLKDVKTLGPWNFLYIIHNNHPDASYSIELPLGEGWKEIVNPHRVVLYNPSPVNNQVDIRELGTYVFCKK